MTRTPVRSGDLLVLACIGGIVLGGLVLHPVTGPEGIELTLWGISLPSVCWFRRATGFPCAGCGVTRSVVLLLHGRPHESIAQHPFGIALLMMAVLQLPPRAAGLFGHAGRWSRLWDRTWLRAGLMIAVLLLAWWMVRVGPALYHAALP